WKNPSYRRKFLLRSLLKPLGTAKLLSSLAQHPDLLLILNAQPGLPCRLHRPWLSLTFDEKKTLAALDYHYKTLYARLPTEVRSGFFTPQGVTFAKLTGKNGEQYTIRFYTDPMQDKEGEATLVFCDEQRTQLAGMTFALCLYEGKRTLFIGGLQGAKANIPHEFIQAATKSCHGLFPKRLLLEACTELASYLGMEQIIAVSNDTHIYQSWRYRKKKQDKLHADYDSFWESLSGERTAEGTFRLPMLIVRKTMEEIASKKRAEYRRRYDLLDSLQNQMRQILHR
ncbi:MAG: VirK/YbjX family protein, partial [Enterobacteriaceae bacterium]|nr:VirK/YbjX family protein [Enterobacteriaceae bacterium]